MKSKVHVIGILPSMFKPYDFNKIEIRDFTFEELLYLGSENLPEESLINIYKEAILNVDVMNLSWPDFKFLMTHISLLTKPEQQWQWNLICHFCENQFQKIIDGKNFYEFKDLDIPDYPIRATIQDKELEFGVLTVENHLKYEKESDDIPEPLLPIYALSLLVKNIPQKEAFELFKTITDEEDIDTLNEIDTLLDHDVKPMELECPHCKEKDFYKVGLEVSTITPFCESRIPSRSRISFGKRST